MAGLIACCVAAGCGRGVVHASAAWQVEPTPPITGAATTVRVTLSDARGPLPGARLQLDAHMSHPGMTPVTARMVEGAPGVYEARIQLSMSGEWTLVATGELAGGGRITSQFVVAAGKPSG
jgi:hypothetical protein